MAHAGVDSYADIEITLPRMTVAAGTDAYSFLAAIGHDCVGAPRFVGDADNNTATINSHYRRGRGEKIESELPTGFPEAIHGAVKDAMSARLRSL